MNNFLDNGKKLGLSGQTRQMRHHSVWLRNHLKFSVAQKEKTCFLLLCLQVSWGLFHWAAQCWAQVCSVFWDQQPAGAVFLKVTAEVQEGNPASHPRSLQVPSAQAHPGEVNSSPTMKTRSPWQGVAAITSSK